MNVGTLLLVLLVLACPLMMVFMHRGGHGAHGGHDDDGATPDRPPGTPSLDELRSRRDEIDGEIARLEEAESSTRSPTAA